MCFVGKYNVFLQKTRKDNAFFLCVLHTPAGFLHFTYRCMDVPLPGCCTGGNHAGLILSCARSDARAATFTLLPTQERICLQENPDIMHKEYVGKRIIHLFICNFADHAPPTVPAIRHHSADIGNPLSSLFRFLTCTCPLNSLCSGLPLNFRIRTPSFPPPPV